MKHLGWLQQLQVDSQVIDCAGELAFSGLTVLESSTYCDLILKVDARARGRLRSLLGRPVAAVVYDTDRFERSPNELTGRPKSHTYEHRFMDPPELGLHGLSFGLFILPAVRMQCDQLGDPTYIAG